MDVGQFSNKAEQIYTSQEQVGIIKSSGAEEDSSGFYRQKKYLLNEGWSFSFYAELEEAKNKKTYSTQSTSYLPVGGEKVPFILEAIPLPQWPASLAPVAPTGASSRVLLLSDAYVENIGSLLSYCQYAFVGDPLDFRAIQTKVNDTHQYYNLTGRDKGKVKDRAGFSTLYQLIPRGSVFRVENSKISPFTNILNQAQAWKTIGYNAYQVITP